MKPVDPNTILPPAAAISRFSILLLSGIVVGAAAAGMFDRELVANLLCCGLAGIFAFIGCELAAARRARLDEARLRKRMESRLEKHVASNATQAGELLSYQELEAALSAIRLGP